MLTRLTVVFERQFLIYFLILLPSHDVDPALRSAFVSVHRTFNERSGPDWHDLANETLRNRMASRIAASGITRSGETCRGRGIGKGSRDTLQSRLPPRARLTMRMLCV